MSVLFDLDFERGKLYSRLNATHEFDQVVLDRDGGMVINTVAPLFGTYDVKVSPKQSYRQYGVKKVGYLTRFRQRIYFHIDTLTIPTTKSIVLLREAHSDLTRYIYKAWVHYTNPNWFLEFAFQRAVGESFSATYNFDPAVAHYLETDWLSSVAAGYYKTWLDGGALWNPGVQNTSPYVVRVPAVGVVEAPNSAVAGAFRIDRWTANDDGSAIGA